MSYTARGITIDFDTELANVLSPATALGLQDLVDTVREAEASEEGICFDKIMDAEGKGSLGGSASTGVLVTLLGGWLIEFWASAGQVAVSGGNIADGLAKFSFVAGTQIVLEQPLGATLVETGVSGLTAQESAYLDAIALRMLETWRLMGLDPANPMTVTPTSRVAGDISQAITGDGETTTTVTRQ